MKEPKGLYLNVGAASIILIILVFALCTFAALSIKASNNEYKLAKKTAVSVQEYYKAEKEALEKLEEYTADDGMIGFTVDINENSSLVVNAEKNLDGSVSVYRWQMLNEIDDISEYSGNENGIVIEDEIWDGGVE